MNLKLLCISYRFLNLKLVPDHCANIFAHQARAPGGNCTFTERRGEAVTLHHPAGDRAHGTRWAPGSNVPTCPPMTAPRQSNSMLFVYCMQLPNLIAPAIVIRAEDLMQCSLQLYTVHTVHPLSEVASLQEAHLHMPNCKDTTEHGRNANIAAKQKSSPLAKRVLVTL